MICLISLFALHLTEIINAIDEIQSDASQSAGGVLLAKFIIIVAGAGVANGIVVVTRENGV